MLTYLSAQPFLMVHFSFLQYCIVKKWTDINNSFKELQEVAAYII
jgi:hypothetical protein